MSPLSLWHAGPVKRSIALASTDVVKVLVVAINLTPLAVLNRIWPN